MRIRSRHYSLEECGGLFFAIALSILGFKLIDGIIRILFPSLYVSSFATLNLLLAVIFAYFFQLSGSSLVGLIPYLPLSRFIFILGVKRDLGLELNFFQMGDFYYPINLLISLIFFSLSSSTAESWAFLFPQKEEYPPPLDSKRYYEWVTSPTHRIDRIPYLRRVAVHWISILFLLIIILATIWEWKKEIPDQLWYITILYFLVYLIFVWYGILKARITEKELDGHIISDKSFSKSLFLPILILSSVFFISLILPWGYSPLSLSKLGDFLARLFQPKPVDYGTPLVNPLFWRFRVLYLRPRIITPTTPERFYIPNYILWMLLSIGISFLVLLLVRIGFFAKVLSILKEGFVRLFYSIVEISKEFGFIKNINTPNIRLPKLISIERPSTILGWIVYYYQLSLKIMAKKDLGKEKWETPYEYARRLESLMPVISAPYWKITEIFVTSRYKKTTPKKEWISNMKESIKEVRERLK
ncbi:MAG: DUF4129 domain-containing protein [bacterium]|nr:DUF4129 domain-containing protein [bacterium]